MEDNILKNSFEILGLTENATRQEVHDAYHDLKIKYASERFMEGEVGANAARKLSELEVAYNDCIAELDNKVTIEETGSQYGKIADLIKGGDLQGAQKLLDDIEARDADWHYYQSVVYYKRDWISESKKQLEIACALDPTNEKFKKALERMNEATKQNHQSAPNEARAGYTAPPQQAAPAGATCCDGCCALMCCDSCCECMGGDLCSCC